MSLSLSLCPIEELAYGAGSHSCWGYSHSVLSLGNLTWDLGQEIADAATLLPADHNITGLLAKRIKDGSNTGERMYGTFDKDCYGSPYKWIDAEILLPFLKKRWPQHPATAYIAALKHDNHIVLDWT